MEKITLILKAIGGILAGLYFLYCVYRYAEYGTEPSRMEMFVVIMLSV